MDTDDQSAMIPPRYQRLSDELAEATREESGCLAYDLFESAAAPGVFVTLERWTDQLAALVGAGRRLDHTGEHLDGAGHQPDADPAAARSRPAGARRRHSRASAGAASPRRTTTCVSA